MLAACAVLALALSAFPALGATPFSHDLLDRVLQARVDSAGRVDYAGLKGDRAALDAYVDSLGRHSPRSEPALFPSKAHELAYWIDAYNAFVLRGVVDAYPVASVKEIAVLNGFFRRTRFVAGGEELTLDQIENEIIRPVYQEPRIHAAINCGAASCPPLGNRAFTGDGLDAQLEAAFRRFAHDPVHVRLDEEEGTLHLSKILDWFGGDFVRWFPQDRQPRPERPTLVDYLLPYLPLESARYLRQHPDAKLSFGDYDWSLNAQVPPARD